MYVLHVYAEQGLGDENKMEKFDGFWFDYYQVKQQKLAIRNPCNRYGLQNIMMNL